MAMNPEIKAEWLKALRSGEYPQTKHVLRRLSDLTENRPVGYCCLGVLCEVAVKAGAIPAGEAPMDEPDVMYYLGEDCTLPEEVQEWASIPSDGTLAELMHLNDEGKDFAYIAGVIEQRL